MVIIVYYIDFGIDRVICLKLIFSAVSRKFLLVNNSLRSSIGNRKPKDLQIVFRLVKIAYKIPHKELEFKGDLCLYTTG